MTIYLYKKTHNITGLQYLGKTIQDPFTYKGSGKRWGNHIKKHGYDVTTEILKECKTKEEIKMWGLYYSNLWNIVDERDESGKKTWANLKPEAGDGGKTRSGESHPMKNPVNVEKVKAAWTEEKRKESGRKTSSWAAARTSEHQSAINKKLKLAWDTATNRKEHLKLRMLTDNPSKNPEIIKKIAGTKANWTEEKRKEVLAKTSGKNHYRNNPDYVSTQIGKTHPRFNPVIRVFRNSVTGEEIHTTVYDFINTYQLPQGNVSLVVNGYRKSVKGWILIS